MATITPSVVNSPKETATSKGGYLRLTITSITDSDAETNKRYIGCKLTIEGTRWVGLYKWESTLGGQTVSSETRSVEDWYPGHVLATKNLTFDNDSAGNLSLTAYIKHIFYKGSGSWNTSYAKSITETLVCSQLPRYANFTSHSATSTLNTITVSYAADAAYGAQQYKLDNGDWTNCTAGGYTLSGFTPGSSHTIKTRIQRSDSGLWTESSQISISLKSLPTSNNVSNVNFNSSGTRVDASISSKDYLSQWYVKIYDGNTLVRDGSNAPNYASSTSDYWTIQNSDNSNMLNRHGSVNSWTLTVKFYVVSNGTTYELSSKTCTCTIPSGSYLPTYNSNNLSYAVLDTESNDITGSNQKVIKGISDVRISTTQASPQGGASMSSYTATSGTKSGTSTNLSNTYIDLTNVDSNSFSVQATDTRGRSTVASKSYSTYIDYFAPYINSGGISISRVDGVTANLNISISGKYMNWSGLSTLNTITQVAVQYKLRSSSSWTTLSGFNLSISASSGNFTASGITTGNVFNISNEYDIKIILKDRFTNVEAAGIIYTANVLLWKDLSNHRLGIGKKPTVALDVNGDILGNNITGTTINGYKITELASGTDFNNVLSDGLYIVRYSPITGGTSSSPTGSCGTLYVQSTMGTPYQVYIPDGGGGVLYKRSIRSGQMTNWVEIGPSNVAKTNVNNYFSTTQSISGNLYIDDGGFFSCGSYLNIGLSVSGVDANNYTNPGIYYLTTGCSNVPANWFYLIPIRASYSGSADMIQLGLSSSSVIYVRFRNGSTWGNWIKYPRITYGTGDPSGGIDGDIYIKYS